jgi:uncharacterized protein YqgC (DUF456 family)
VLTSFQPLFYLAVLVLMAIALILAFVPRRLGHAIAWTAAAAYGAWMALVVGATPFRLVAFGLTMALTALGFFIEPLTRRFDLRVRWVDQRTAWGALIGVFIGLFLGGSLLIAILGALIGAIVAELTDKRALDHAFRSGIGAVLALFGPHGLRLLFTVAIISVFMSTWGRFTVPAL